MGVDYYKILQVDRSAKEDDLKKAYLRFSEAYDVISDPKKRAVYDQYGEEGLKGQVPPPSSPGGTSSRSNPRSADDIFVETFGSSNPFGGTSSRSNPRSTDGIFVEPFGSSSPFGGGGMGAGGGTRGGRSPGGGMPADDVFREFFGRGGGEGSVFPLRQQKAAAIENQLPCSLEELYKGTTKKMKISREILDFSGKSLLVEEILTIHVKPGWKKGTKIAFPEKGNQASNIIPADVVFIVDEKPHDVYTREGNDLVMTQRITLLEALLGFTVQLATLDGRSLTVPVNTIIHPGYEEVVPQEGMPIPRNPSERGTLRIKFNIKFPSRLTAEQKTGLMKLLPARLP